MSVSIIIVNWNSGKMLNHCLDFIAKQTLKPDVIYVVDNASSDGSSDCVAHFPGIRLISPGQNIGFAAGNNHAITLCKTEFVALLNPDAFPESNWLENLVASARIHSEYAAFGSRQFILGKPDFLDGVGDTYHVSGLVWRNRHGQIQSEQDLAPKDVFSPCAAAALYRRNAIEAVGGFDEDYFCYVEDVDLGFRLRLAGFKAMYVPDAIVFHHGSASTGGQHSDFSLYHGHRNLVWTFIKNMPSALFWPLLPLHLLLNLFTMLFFILHGQSRIIVRAKRDACFALPHIWRKRKIIQKNRTASARDIWRALDKGFFCGRII